MNTTEPFQKTEGIGSHAQFPVNMDYSYFHVPGTESQQPYHFMALPPTPAPTNNFSSDQYSNESPPDAFDQFQTFDTFGHFNNNGILEPPTPPSQKLASATSNASEPMDGNAEMTNADARQGSNSDDEDMTPAQSRRKAQNRAAQRAFRERKERHVKELEAQVAALKQSSSNIAAENEQLKLSLQKVATENEILKATSHQRSSLHTPPQLPDTGPMRFSPTDFVAEVLHDHPNTAPTVVHRITTDANGGRLYDPGATWDFILKHPLFQRGMVDMSAVSEYLKGRAVCDGQGPVFPERVILDAVERSVASGSDELL